MESDLLQRLAVHFPRCAARLTDAVDIEPPVSEDELALEVEECGVPLPDSYKMFLRCSRAFSFLGGLGNFHLPFKLMETPDGRPAAPGSPLPSRALRFCALNMVDEAGYLFFDTDGGLVDGEYPVGYVVRKLLGYPEVRPEDIVSVHRLADSFPELLENLFQYDELRPAVELASGSYGVSEALGHLESSDPVASPQAKGEPMQSAAALIEQLQAFDPSDPEPKMFETGYGSLVASGWVAERCAAAEALADLGPEAAPAIIPFLIAALSDDHCCWELSDYGYFGDERVGDRAAKALANIGPPAVAPLMEALRDERKWRRAVRALGNIGPAAQAAVPALLQPVQNQPDPAVWFPIFEALRNIRPPAEQVLPVLFPLVNDKQPSWRWSLRTIAAIAPDSPQLADAIQRHFNDLEWEDLGDIFTSVSKDDHAKQPYHAILEELRQDGDPLIREKATTCLGMLKGEPDEPSTSDQ